MKDRPQVSWILRNPELARALATLGGGTVGGLTGGAITNDNPFSKVLGIGGGALLGAPAGNAIMEMLQRRSLENAYNEKAGAVKMQTLAGQIVSNMVKNSQYERKRHPVRNALMGIGGTAVGLTAIYQLLKHYKPEWLQKAFGLGKIPVSMDAIWGRLSGRLPSADVRAQQGADIAKNLAGETAAGDAFNGDYPVSGQLAGGAHTESPLEEATPGTALDASQYDQPLAGGAHTESPLEEATPVTGLMGKQQAALDVPSRAYVFGMVKACEVRGIDPRTLVREEYIKQVMK